MRKRTVFALLLANILISGAVSAAAGYVAGASGADSEREPVEREPVLKDTVVGVAVECDIGFYGDGARLQTFQGAVCGVRDVGQVPGENVSVFDKRIFVTVRLADGSDTYSVVAPYSTIVGTGDAWPPKFSLLAGGN